MDDFGDSQNYRVDTTLTLTDWQMCKHYDSHEADNSKHQTENVQIQNSRSLDHQIAYYDYKVSHAGRNETEN